MTRNEEKELLEKILSDENLTEAMKADLQKLKDSYNEQKGAEDEPEKEIDEWEELVKARDEAIKQRDEAMQKFRDVKEKYIRRIITPEKAISLHEEDYKNSDFEDIEKETKKEDIFKEEEIIK